MARGGGRREVAVSAERGAIWSPTAAMAAATTTTLRCVRLFLLLQVLPAGQAQLSMFQSVLQYYRGAVNVPPGAVSDTDVFLKEYDFVVVGAGSGGSVVTNRLTELPNWSVLLLEAGKEEILLTDIPLLVSYILATDYNWGYKTQPQEGICLSMAKRRCNWHRGKGMGGTSVINYMVYTRGSKKDYDDWERLGNPGWSYDDVLPYFKKSENIAVPQLKDSPYHGSGGYLNVDKAHWATPLGKIFIEALKERGYPSRDCNNPVPIGVFPVLSTTLNGARLSAAKAFIRPIRNRRNMHVGKEARVTKILIDSKTKRALGVMFVKNRKTHVVRVRKEVILSAGSLNSPQLLMLSGVGPKDHLDELGIPVIKDLRVGYNLQDHVSMAGLTFQVNDTVTIVESRYRDPQYLMDYLLNGNGPYTMPGGAEAIAFTRTKYNNDSDQPDMELVMGPGSFLGDTGGTLYRSFNIRDDVFNKMYGSRMGTDGFGIVPILLQPRSRGRVMLKSKNPFHWPLLYPNYYTDPRDVDVLVEGIKQAVEIGESGPFQRYRSRLLRVPVPGCEKHSFGSDQYWECTIRHFTTNLHHQVGTCKMGPVTDPEAVVDARLRVHGVAGLRVVDASVMPVIPTGHTNAIIFMIGEKAADLIKQDWANTARRRSTA